MFNKTFRIFLVFTLIIFTLDVSAQDKSVIRLGVKNKVPDAKIESLIANNEYNFIDAFEYELLKELLHYASQNKSYEIELVPINQSDKLASIVSGNDIDALLYTFSETAARKDTGIIFSSPYFQNKAIGLILNREDIDLKNLNESPVRVGFVANTTVEKELKKLKNRYKDNLLLEPKNNHLELISALKEKSIDAAAGDVSRLIFDLNEGDFFFGGNLPTKRSKIRDNYCVGIAPGKSDVLPFFNGFVSNSQKSIAALENKWLSTALEDAYQSYYNKEENQLKSSIQKIISVGAGAIILLILLFALIIRRKNRRISDIETDKHEKKMGKIFSLYEAKGRANIDAAGIAKIGIDFFNTAKKITYVGSGGFLSDQQFGEQWSKSMHDFLSRKGTTFERVIDLPKMEVNSENEVCFSKTSNFFPSRLESNYISRYLKWLCIQYNDLQHYPNLKIIDSRGAALWSYGIVIIIKDETEVLFFTTNKNTKIGSPIRDAKLAKQISTVIYDMSEIGKEVNVERLTKLFFMEDPRLINLRKRIDNVKNKTIEKNLMSEIDLVCREIQESIIF